MQVRQISVVSLERDGQLDPIFGQRLLSSAMAQLVELRELSIMLGRKSAQEKVASFLAMLAEKAGVAGEKSAAFDIPMSRNDIADFLGLTVETVSRKLSCLRQQGVIKLPHVYKAVVLDMERLRDLADCMERFSVN